MTDAARQVVAALKQLAYANAQVRVARLNGLSLPEQARRVDHARACQARVTTLRNRSMEALR